MGIREIMGLNNDEDEYEYEQENEDDYEDEDEEEEEDPSKRVPWDEQRWWRATHAFGFMLGGTTFWVGTILYYYPEAAALGLDQGNISGWLYVIGSSGFLYVDVLEFFTYTTDKWLRLNISMSATGSLLYLIGSAGFIPKLYAMTSLVGIWGFILGSFAIAVSQTWKVYRINQGEGGIIGSKDNFTAACVEGGACLGACGFFFGTILYNSIQDNLVGDPWMQVLAMWMFGSTLFTCGGLSLTFRHAVMGV